MDGKIEIDKIMNEHKLEHKNFAILILSLSITVVAILFSIGINNLVPASSLFGLLIFISFLYTIILLFISSFFGVLEQIRIKTEPGVEISRILYNQLMSLPPEALRTLAPDYEVDKVEETVQKKKKFRFYKFQIYSFSYAFIFLVLHFILKFFCSESLL